MKAECTRRDFLKTTTAAGAGLVIGFYLPAKSEAQPPVAPFAPNAWLQISPRGIVTVWVAKSEMGQGVRTSLPMLVAEELDADWEKVRVEAAPFDPKYGNQGTGGSTSVRTGWEPLRKAGATARDMLLTAAAQNWGVPKRHCRTDVGYVFHPVTKRRFSYGALAEAAAKLPVPAEVRLKTRDEFRVIGQRLHRTDAGEKVDGSAQFGLDVRVPGMLYASVARCPVLGGKVTKFDGARAKTVAGVREVVQIESGVAVVADSVWTAMEGRKLLDLTWEEGGSAGLSSAKIAKLLADLAKKEGAVAHHAGDPTSALEQATKKIEAVYEFPYLAHATLEPMNCTADVRKDSCEVWSPTQFPSWVSENAAKITGLDEKQIKVNITHLGGGFGRRAEADFSIEALALSKAVGAPVQVVWTREDDMQHDWYRPTSYHVLNGAINAAGQAAAFTHRVVAPSIAGQRGWLKEALDNSAVEAAGIPYAVPNIHVDYVMANTAVPVGWWRSVYASQNAIAAECFVDELAAAVGKDPYEFRAGLLAKSPRHKGVLELAATKAGWGKALPAGRGRGIAVVNSFGSYVAQVAEVSVGADGLPKVERVVCAVDCGQYVNPDIIEAQMEGAIAYGLSAVLYGKITVERGRVQQGDFNDYPILRMNEMPKVEVHIVESTEKPGGIGEPGLPPLAPAVLNAIFAATGKRVRKLPLKT